MKAIVAVLLMIALCMTLVPSVEAVSYCVQPNKTCVCALSCEDSHSKEPCTVAFGWDKDSYQGFVCSGSGDGP